MQKDLRLENGETNHREIEVAVGEKPGVEALLLSKLLDVISESVVIFDPEGIIIYGNQAACRDRGYRLKEFLKLNIKDIEASGCLPSVELGRETVHRRRDGSLFPVEADTHPIKIEDQRYFLSTFRDVTRERKSQMALAQSEARFRQVAENAEEWIWETDEQGIYTYSNNICLKILGYRPEELVGRLNCRDLYPPETSPEVLQQSAAIRSQRQGFRNFRRPIKRRDGRIIFVECNGEPYFDAEGRFLGYRGADRDITERQALEEERERIILELQEALENIKTLKGLIPICAGCRRIRNDQGFWKQVDVYLRDHTEADVSHSLCPECAARLYPEFAAKLSREEGSLQNGSKER